MNLSPTLLSADISVSSEAVQTAISGVTDIIDTLTPVFRGAGFVLLVYGIYKAVMAFKDDDTDSKIKAITMIVMSTVYITVNIYVDALYGITGIRGG